MDSRIYIPSVYFSIMVNNSLSDFFSSSQGLRQGDLLSLVLFVLVMEVLNKMLKKNKEGRGGGGVIIGFWVGHAPTEGLIFSLI